MPVATNYISGILTQANLVNRKPTHGAFSCSCLFSLCSHGQLHSSACAWGLFTYFQRISWHPTRLAVRHYGHTELLTCKMSWTSPSKSMHPKFLQKCLLTAFLALPRKAFTLGRNITPSSFSPPHFYTATSLLLGHTGRVDWIFICPLTATSKSPFSTGCWPRNTSKRKS